MLGNGDMFCSMTSFISALYFWTQINILIEKESLSVLDFPPVLKWELSMSRIFWVTVSCVPLLLLFSMRISEHSVVKARRPSNV